MSFSIATSWARIPSPKRIILTKLSLLLSVFATPATFLAAQEQSAEAIAEIVVVANRTPVANNRIATSVTVLDQQDIEDHGNVAISDILRQSTAVGVSRNGGNGSTSSLRIRGEEGFRTLVLFDGMRMGDPSAPQVSPSLEHILSSGISRIEILRGPQGMVYGADAGGVVSISTKRGQEGFDASLDAQRGSYDTEQIAATLSGANESADFMVTATELNSAGYNVRTSDNVLADDDGYENTNFYGRLGFDLSERWRVDLRHRQVDAETEYDGCFSGTTVHDCQSFYEITSSAVSLNYDSGTISHNLSYQNTQSDRDDHALGVSSFTSVGEISRVEYIGTANELPGLDLTWGIDLEQEERGSVERDNEGYYLTVLSDFSDSLFLSAGIRRDDNDDFGEHDSYRLSAAYNIELNGASLKLKTSYGTGFRAPSLSEIAYNFGPFSFPPAAGLQLSEETSNGFEYGFEYSRGDRFYLELVSFDQEIEDAIQFDLVGFSGYLQDVGTSFSEGVELTSSFALTDSLSLNANFTYNDTERPNGMQRLRRPEKLSNVGLRYLGLNNKLRINVFYRAASDAIDEVFGTAVALDDYTVVDISASYALSDRIEIYGRIENAFDEEYAEVTDFIAPDSTSSIGFRLKL